MSFSHRARRDLGNLDLAALMRKTVTVVRTSVATRIWLVAILLSLLILSSCSSSSMDYGSAANSQGPTCEDVLASVVQRERTGDTAGVINEELQWLSDRCSTQYSTFTEYASGKSSIRTGGAAACAVVIEHSGPEAIALLQEDGACTGGDAAPPSNQAPAAPQWPNGGLSWDSALESVGTDQRVCGPLASLRNSEGDAFLNLGHDYPSQERFTVIVWGITVEDVAAGTTICATGTITQYEEHAQIELYSVDPIEVWE
ncbi:hypothetical protein [Microbacterium sp. A84]|uniref:hypothetical protein n=1 Tax=Microbacterium sp. A84 TaxID=3450715 RepID=UPI003F44290A